MYEVIDKLTQRLQNLVEVVGVWVTTPQFYGQLGIIFAAVGIILLAFVAVPAAATYLAWDRR
jgi:hypothetical protein